MAPLVTTSPAQADAAFQQINKELDALSFDQVQGGRGDIPLPDQFTFSNILAQQNAVNRTPWIMSCTEWLAPTTGVPRGIVWAANPSDISWQMAQRSMHTKNLYGTVMHVWPDNFRDTFFDEIRLTLNLQSSNIMPVLRDNSPSGWAAAPGLSNFYDFMQLFDAPKLTAEGRPNIVSIQYNSNLFPKLTLLGMFDSAGIRFTDSSANPNMVTSWSVDFIVYDTSPRLTSTSAGQQSNSAMLTLWMQERIDNAKLPR